MSDAVDPVDLGQWSSRVYFTGSSAVLGPSFDEVVAVLPDNRCAACRNCMLEIPENGGRESKFRSPMCRRIAVWLAEERRRMQITSSERILQASDTSIAAETMFCFTSGT